MQGNYIAKNMHKTSKDAVHEDRKKRSKKGYEKHKKQVKDKEQE